MTNSINLKRIHILTALSFVFIVAFFMIFINSAEGIYEFDNDKAVNPYTKIMNFVLAILIIFNVIMIFISLLSLLYICFSRNNMLTKINILLSLYPIILILWISSFDIGIFYQYVTAPINLLLSQ